MYQSFSERIGKKSVRDVLQIASMDDDLKNQIWNCIYDNFLMNYAESPYLELIWKSFFKLRSNELPRHRDTYIHIPAFVEHLDNWYNKKATWNEIYDLLEFICKRCFEDEQEEFEFEQICNDVLAQENSGYRIIDSLIVPLTSEEEIQEIEEALANEFSSVSTHLSTALSLLSDRTTPDYRNSIKESISAVEALCKIITADDSATLAKALAKIEKTHELHGSLKNAFSSIYGYTSDSGGIRHSLTEDGIRVEFEDAKFMLVSCSAFINYLKAKMK
jgi:uncharacterized protein with PIN domain